MGGKAVSNKSVKPRLRRVYDVASTLAWHAVKSWQVKMLRLESYLAPVLSGFLNKYIRNLKADTLQLSLWSGEATFHQLELRLDNIEHEFDLPFELNSGLIRELKIRIPWTRLGSEPVFITIEGLELHCRMRKPQPPAHFTQSLNGARDTASSADAAERRMSRTSSVFAENSTSTESPAGAHGHYDNVNRSRDSTQDPGYLASLLRKAKINARVTVKNISIKYYISSEVVLDTRVDELEFYPVSSGDWKPVYLALPARGQRDFILHRQINVKNLTVRLDDRRQRNNGDQTGTFVSSDDTVRDKNSVLVKTCSFTCRSETVYSNFATRAVKSMRFHSYFLDGVDLSVVTDSLPHLVRLYEYIIAYLSGYVPSAREMRRQANKLPLCATVSSSGGASVRPENANNVSGEAADATSWTGWAKSWMGYDAGVSSADPNGVGGNLNASSAGMQDVIDFLDDEDEENENSSKADFVEYAVFCRQGTLTFATLQEYEQRASADVKEGVFESNIPSLHSNKQASDQNGPTSILPFLKLEGKGISVHVRLTADTGRCHITGNIMQGIGYLVNFYGYPFPEPIFRMSNSVAAQDNSGVFPASISSIKNSLFDLNFRSEVQENFGRDVDEHLKLYDERTLLSRNSALLIDFIKFKPDHADSLHLISAEHRPRRQNVSVRFFTAPLQLLLDDCLAQRLNLLHACVYDRYPYKRPLITPDEDLLFDTLPWHLAEEELEQILEYTENGGSVPTKTLSFVVPGVEVIVVGLHGMARQKNTSAADNNMPPAWMPFLCDDVALEQQRGAPAIILRSPRFEYIFTTPLDHEQIYETFLTLLNGTPPLAAIDTLKPLLFETQILRMHTWNAFSTIFTSSSNCAAANAGSEANAWHAYQTTAYACLLSASYTKLLTLTPSHFEYRFTCAPYARAYPLHDMPCRYTQMYLNGVDVVGGAADLLLAWNCLCVSFWPDMYVDEVHLSNLLANGLGQNSADSMALRMPWLSISFSAYKSGNFRQHHQFHIDEVWLLPKGMQPGDSRCILKTISASNNNTANASTSSYFTQDIVLDVDQQMRTLASGTTSLVNITDARRNANKQSTLHFAETLRINIAAEHVTALLEFLHQSRLTEIYASIVRDDADVETKQSSNLNPLQRPTKVFEFSHPEIRFIYTCDDNSSENNQHCFELIATQAKITTSFSDSAAYFRYENFNFACFTTRHSPMAAYNSPSPPVLSVCNGSFAVECHSPNISEKRNNNKSKWIVIAHAESMPVFLSPTSLSDILTLVKHAAKNAESFRNVFLNSGADNTGQNKIMGRMKPQKNSENMSQKSQPVSHDDLRALPWKYIFHNADVKNAPGTQNARAVVVAPLPKSGEIVFDEGVKTNNDGGAFLDHVATTSMTWQYSEPRSITSLRALPLPLLSADIGKLEAVNVESSPSKKNTSNFRILCNLLYYDELNCLFKNFKTFCLSETQEFLLDANELAFLTKQNNFKSRQNSGGPNSAAECMPVAEMWRIEIQPALQDVNHDFVALFSVAALGGCLIIDSCINCSATPRVQIKLSCQRTEMTLNYCAADLLLMPFAVVNKSRGSGLCIQQEELSVPIEMLKISVDDVEVTARLCGSEGDESEIIDADCKEKTSSHLVIMDVSAWMHATVAELGSQARLPLIDPTCLHVSGTLAPIMHAFGADNHDKLPAPSWNTMLPLSYAKLNLSFSGANNKCAVYMNPSILHALLRGGRAWKYCGRRKNKSMRDENVQIITDKFSVSKNAVLSAIGAHTLLCNNISTVGTTRPFTVSTVFDSCDMQPDNGSPLIYYRQEHQLQNAAFLHAPSDGCMREDDFKSIARRQIVPLYLAAPSGTDTRRLLLTFNSGNNNNSATLNCANTNLPNLLSEHEVGRREWSKPLILADNTLSKYAEDDTKERAPVLYRFALHCLQLNNIQHMYMITGSVLVFNETHMPIIIHLTETVDSPDATDKSTAIENDTKFSCFMKVDTFKYESCAVPAKAVVGNVAGGLCLQFTAVLEAEKAGSEQNALQSAGDLQGSCFLSEIISIVSSKASDGKRRSHCMSKLIRLTSINKAAGDNTLFLLVNILVKLNGIIVIRLTPPLFVKSNDAITWPMYLQPLDATSPTIEASTVNKTNNQYALIDQESRGACNFVAVYNLDLEQCSKLSIKLDNLHVRPTACVDVGRITLSERQLKEDFFKNCPLELVRRHLSDSNVAVFSSACLSGSKPPAHQLHKATVLMPHPPPDVVPTLSQLHAAPLLSVEDDRPRIDITARIINHPILLGCKVLEIIPHGLLVRNELHANFDMLLIGRHMTQPLNVFGGGATTFMPLPVTVQENLSNNTSNKNSTVTTNTLDCPVRLRILSSASSRNESGEIIFRICASKETKKPDKQNFLQNNDAEAILYEAVDCTEYGALPRGGVLRATIASTLTDEMQQQHARPRVRFLLIYLYTDSSGMNVLHLRNAYPVRKSISSPLQTKLFAWPIGVASAAPSLADLLKHSTANETAIHQLLDIDWHQPNSSVLDEVWPVLGNLDKKLHADNNEWRQARYLPALFPFSAETTSAGFRYCPVSLDVNTYKRLAPHRAVVIDDDQQNQPVVRIDANIVMQPQSALSLSNSGLPDVDIETDVPFPPRVTCVLKRKGHENLIKIQDNLFPGNNPVTLISLLPLMPSSTNAGLWFVFYNFCPHEIAVGETLSRRAAVLNETSQTLEDELFCRMPPVVPAAGGRLYYTPPSHALTTITKPADAALADTVITLRFGRLVTIRDPQRPTCIWSEDEASVRYNKSELHAEEGKITQHYVTLSGLCYLKLTCERVFVSGGKNNQQNFDAVFYRVRIDPAGKVNIKDIISASNPQSCVPVPVISPTSAVVLNRPKQQQQQQFVATVKFQSLCICMQDTMLLPNSNDILVIELVRLTLERFQAQIIYAADNINNNRDSSEAGENLEIAVTLHDAQFDNQLALLPPALQQHLLGSDNFNGYFDFPVVLVKGDAFEDCRVNHNQPVSSQKHSSFRNTAGAKLEKHQNEPILNVILNIIWQRKPKNSTRLDVPSRIKLRKIFVSTAPCSVFIEDRFIYTLLQLSDNFLVPDFVKLLSSTTVADKNNIAELKTNSAATTKRLLPAVRPLQVEIEKLFFAPIFINLSLHASLSGLFVAVNSSPLFFDELQLSNISSTTARELAATLFMHYASVTLLKAGMVLGSADLLGNPVGLLRSFGRGIHDAFLMPCIAQTTTTNERGNMLSSSFSDGVGGRLSFSEALARGARSFFSNISAGSLTSITRWFESLSRNLDTLAYDPDYVRRRMELTQNQHQQANNNMQYGDSLAVELPAPPRMAPVLVGLQHGLAGFGFSLLGALAGVVDQPLRAVALQRNNNKKQSASNSQKKQLAMSTALHANPDIIFNIGLDDAESESDDDDETSFSGTPILRALLTGLGRGLLGMVTKPLAGVSSLVAQTGAGMMQSMHMQAPMSRFHNHIVPLEHFCVAAVASVAAVRVFECDATSGKINRQKCHVLALTADCMLTDMLLASSERPKDRVASSLRVYNIARATCEMVPMPSLIANDAESFCLLQLIESVSETGAGGESLINSTQYAVDQAQFQNVQLFCGLVRLVRLKMSDIV